MTKYQRKTKDVWELQVNYGYGSGWEVECVEDSRKDAIEQKRTYNANCNYPVRIVKRRVKIKQDEGWEWVPAPVEWVEFLWDKDHWTIRTRREGLWLVVSNLTGTVADLCSGLAKLGPDAVGFGVLLDRLQEAPEEVVGLDAATVAEAVGWLRAQVANSAN